MVQPKTSSERRSLNESMAAARGGQASWLELPGTAEKEEETTNDWDDTLKSECTATEEDMFLPQRLPMLLETLPQLLRRSKCSTISDGHWTSNQLLNQRRHACSVQLQSWLSALFGRSLQLNKIKVQPISRELFLLNGILDVTATTDFLPTICRMGALEESLEALERRTSGVDTVKGTTRRATRRQTRNARQHYFDIISKRDDATLSAEELGRSMASALLTYRGANCESLC